MLPRMPEPTGVRTTIGMFQSPLHAQVVFPASFKRSMVLKM